MAHQTEKSKQLAELTRRSEVSRLMLSDAHQRLQQTLDLPSRVKSSIKDTPAKWIGGSLVAGFAASFLFRSRKKKAPARIIAAKKSHGLLALLFTLSKPAVKIYATKLLRDYLTRRFVTDPQGRPGTRPAPPY